MCMLYVGRQVKYAVTCWLVSFQISFDGLTGHVQFDKRGYRKGYKLDILTVSLDRGPHKVTLMDCLSVRLLCLHNCVYIFFTLQCTQEVKNERLLIWTRQTNALFCRVDIKKRSFLTSCVVFDLFP